MPGARNCSGFLVEAVLTSLHFISCTDICIVFHIKLYTEWYTLSPIIVDIQFRPAPRCLVIHRHCTSLPRYCKRMNFDFTILPLFQNGTDVGCCNGTCGVDVVLLYLCSLDTMVTEMKRNIYGSGPFYTIQRYRFLERQSCIMCASRTITRMKSWKGKLAYTKM